MSFHIADFFSVKKCVRFAKKFFLENIKILWLQEPTLYGQ